MYTPELFKVEDLDSIYEIIEENSFAILTSQNGEEISVTHLPLILDREKQILIGHFALQNNHPQEIQNGKVLVIFTGPHCYISPSWYETKNAVPTWNYIAVHIHGTLKILEDKSDLLQGLQKLVSKFEPNAENFSLSEVNSETLNRLSSGIVGFRIQIEKMEAKFKLSQNHSIERQNLVANQLSKMPRDQEKAISEFMKRRLGVK